MAHALLVFMITGGWLLFFSTYSDTTLRGGSTEVAHHHVYARQAAANRARVVFLGDSLTYGWGGTPPIPGQDIPVSPQPVRALWADFFAPLGVANFGYPGDDTKSLRWRIEHGELAGLPDVAVVLIGTNDLVIGHTPEETAEGIKAAVTAILRVSPTTRVLLFGVFPGRASPTSPYRTRVQAVNERLSAWDKPAAVHYLDIGHLFISSDGSIPATMMTDGIHLSEVAYRIWANAIQEQLKTLSPSLMPPPDPSSEDR